MHNGKMNAIMLAIVEMEAAFATLASKDTNVKWNIRPTIQPPTPLSFTQNQGTKNILKSHFNFRNQILYFREQFSPLNSFLLQ